MEPGHEDREYRPGHVIHETVDVASMEPGHEDREYGEWAGEYVESIVPQWSPVMKTGNTWRPAQGRPRRGEASMEPGHEDREYG